MRIKNQGQLNGAKNLPSTGRSSNDRFGARLPAQADSGSMAQIAAKAAVRFPRTATAAK